MKIKELIVENFRGYKEPISISFDNFTAFIGKNDIGKSSILECLDIFFNDGKGAIKLDKDDINKDALSEGKTDIIIQIIFNELPEELVIDEKYKTTLKDEYLLNSNGELQIKKTFKNGSSSSLKVSIIANHPSYKKCDSLLTKKHDELEKILNKEKIVCDDLRTNSIMRKAIWKHYQNELCLSERELEISTKGDDIKNIWEKIQTILPEYALFQSDRKNTDEDDEIQDPLKIAVKQILTNTDLQNKLSEVANSIKQTLQEVSDLTLEKLKEMNPSIAKSLNPNIDFAKLKWADVFKNVSITGDNDIPLNKRGSGVKRLVLISFFRAEAERNKKNSTGIIYSIEEPETAQHIEHQKLLINSLKSLSQEKNIQVIITTHNANIVKEIDFNNIRVISNDNNKKKVSFVKQNILPTPSLNEINYLVFGDISEAYHNELYGYLQAKSKDDNKNHKSTEKYFDEWLTIHNKKIKKEKKWKKDFDNGNTPNECTIQTYIRNYYHHPENTLNTKYNEKELRESIEQLIEVAMSLK